MPPSVPALPVTDDALARRMAALGVTEADLEETFIRSSGHGGQNVNKTSTCVVLRHRPTGIQVRCQDTRQQGQNRERARHLLLDKIEAQRQREAAAQRADAERLRRQKRGRSRSAKLRILADKSRHSAKKQARRPDSND
jgi:protein subunit release factor B